MPSSDGEVVRSRWSRPRARVSTWQSEPFAFARPDISVQFGPARYAEEARPGFLRFFELPAPSLLDRGWIAELAAATANRVEIPRPRSS